MLAVTHEELQPSSPAAQPTQGVFWCDPRTRGRQLALVSGMLAVTPEDLKPTNIAAQRA
jgi:hypothetical protein